MVGRKFLLGILVVIEVLILCVLYEMRYSDYGTLKHVCKNCKYYVQVSHHMILY